MMLLAKLTVLKNLEYSGTLTKNGLGISTTIVDQVIEDLLEENLIKINGIFISITEDGLVYC